MIQDENKTQILALASDTN